MAGNEPGPDDKKDFRKARRVPVGFSVHYRGKGVSGQGFVRNISFTGALIEEAEPLLVAGGDIKLRFSFFKDSDPVEVTAQVVRETPGGFAVRFQDMTPRIRHVLNLAITRLSARHHDPFDDDDDTTLLDVRR